MNKRMLIDTTHAEETRVVVTSDDRLEDYDVETSARKQLKGNIYLAKVIRVEPSLQAAFVDYGGNRHGFLAFSEIHPDYFQIPVADREKLLALQDEEARFEEQRAETEVEEAPAAEAENDSSDEPSDDHETLPETVGGEHDTGDESAAARRTARFLRNYKIQEVIRRRQVILVQVVKEERGNKGAALTTYVSLAGRYCVLMPNALRGGGVSRKITSDSDRKRLREIIADLELPRGMAMIVRTAGAQRPGPEITRDCEYLLQLWDDIRSHTLSSVAPTLVYEEASLIKRAIRDLFSKDIEEIVIDGETAWKNAREFMRLLMPHSVNKVKLWRDPAQSLFARYHVEGQLDAMFQPTAQLKSGGYLVINQTEALVSIDVNSGRSTSQRNIEETALRTNLEAAEEVARQLRLRDLAGLVVIDFIDMESRKHNHMVEKRLKDALRSDRARIQVGSISHFGLLEMSRQRLRPSIAESVLTPCPHCQGTGYVRGTESAALHILRAIDDEGASQKAAEIEVHVVPGVALYILNNKRGWLTEIEQRHRMHVVFQPDAALLPSDIRIERIRPQTAAAPLPQVTTPTEAFAGPVETLVTEEVETQHAPAHAVTEGEDREEGPRRKRRRRRGRRDRDRRHDDVSAAQESASPPAEESEDASVQTDGENIMPGRRRTRTRRLTREEENGTVSEIAAPAEEEPARPAEPAERPFNRRDRFRQDQQHRENPRDDRAPRVWNGPTPANPFGGGSFDIFDVIEQAENEQAPRKNIKHVPIAQRDGATARQAAESAIAVETPAASEATLPTPQLENASVSETAHTLSAPEAPSASVAETKPAPRRRGRPRKDAVEAPEPAPEKTAATTDAKPTATKARSRKKTAVENPASAAEVAEKPAPRRRGRPRKETVAEGVSDAPPASEAPKAEPVTEAPAIVPVDVDAAAPPKRPRAGWWKR
ncbi:ribonuclease E [Neoasaia chiangmaiensis NBRC 101099]|uniref:Ribonuclease E n=1 Tax=Neoasaia chiangmaiensis TaxID=320497 RepID=A0A1U9KST9_9PROT|nr:ribonuclease E/G [Neoasaia chiangmaiensis]AQS88797.1 ribonuclease E [Neoasaia chiangmaiensis]GBR40744.1 ribonuclease E [Neoasaia chiangmaiensis NBRC 101099]GEN13758.1 ribonuclease E [Neoasaia chiangmaiensis]